MFKWLFAYNCSCLVSGRTVVCLYHASGTKSLYWSFCSRSAAGLAVICPGFALERVTLNSNETEAPSGIEITAFLIGPAIKLKYRPSLHNPSRLLRRARLLSGFMAGGTTVHCSQQRTRYDTGIARGIRNPTPSDKSSKVVLKLFNARGVH